MTFFKERVNLNADRTFQRSEKYKKILLDSVDISYPWVQSHDWWCTEIYIMYQTHRCNNNVSMWIRKGLTELFLKLLRMINN